MLTWEVLRSIYPTHTYHMEDNPAYSDIVATRNVIAKASRALYPSVASPSVSVICRRCSLLHRELLAAWYAPVQPSWNSQLIREKDVRGPYPPSAPRPTKIYLTTTTSSPLWRPDFRS